MKELEAHLRGCSVRQLIVAMRLMRSDKDTVGFDYSKIRKEELIDRAVTLAGGMTADKREKISRMMEKAFGWTAADLAEKVSAVGGGKAGTDAGKSKKKGYEALDAYASYGSADEQHGPEQGGSPNEGESREASDKGREEAKQVIKEAAAEAAKEAVAERASELDKQTEELMERLSKAVFKIEVVSDSDDGESGDDQQKQEGQEGAEGQEGEEGKSPAEADSQDGKGKKRKKKRTIESGTPRHEVFQEVCQAVNKGLNVLLVGPAGCGKTHMAQDIANVLALPFKFTGAVSSEYKLLGFMTAQG